LEVCGVNPLLWVIRRSPTGWWVEL